MVDDVGCIYCRKWDAEVGPIYEQSATGRVAPLARRPKRHADLAPYEPLVYTPTFVLVRDGIEVYSGTIASLRRFKDDVREVKEGYECGIGIENFNDIKIGDVIECFRKEEVARTLEPASAAT